MLWPTIMRSVTPNLPVKDARVSLIPLELQQNPQDEIQRIPDGKSFC